MVKPTSGYRFSGNPILSGNSVPSSLGKIKKPDELDEYNLDPILR
jgi:hypothetical protein